MRKQILFEIIIGQCLFYTVATWKFVIVLLYTQAHFVWKTSYVQLVEKIVLELVVE